MRRSWTDSRGTVSLLVLSLVTVLAISLAGYITVSSRSMRLANRVFLNGLASNLAESGVEQALWTLNESDWTSWTAVGGGALASGDTVAVRTITFASTKYGSSGVVGSINIRIHGRNAKQWMHWESYTTGDIVWHLGRWWQCVSNHGPVTVTTFPSTTANWIPAPSAWNAAVTYSAGTSATNADIVISGGTAYRCTAANTNSQPPSANWTSLGTPVAWSATASYSVNAVVTYQGTVYRCRAANTGFVPTDTTYWVGAPAIHAEGVATPPGATLGGSSGAVRVQVRAELAPVPLFPNALGAGTEVLLSSTGNIGSYLPNVVSAAAATWTSGTSYTTGTLVVDNNAYYRSLSNHTANASNRPGAASSQWSNSLLQGSAAVLSAPSVRLTNSANVWGYVSAPSTSFASGAVVKHHSGLPASPNQDASRIASNSFVPTPTILSVSGGTNLPAPHSGNVLNEGAFSLGTAGATTPVIYNIAATWVYGNTYSGLLLWDSGQVLTINGPVILNVSGDVYIRSGSIVVANTGSLELYFNGQLQLGDSTSSSGGIVNNTTNRDPKRIILVGTDNYTWSGYHEVQSTVHFHGLIYMPDAYISNRNATSGAMMTRYGAQSAATVRFHNPINFQYDASLRTAGRLARFVDAPFYVSAWRELTDPAERVTF